jgi:predicted alpha-1,2-mannosidase
MIGDGPASILASTYAFGARSFDHYGALAVMMHGAEDPSATSSGHPVREGAAEYLALGFVPEDKVGASASRTLEYGIADFSLSRLADALGDPDFAAEGLARSAAWRKLFSAARGIPVPRDSAGAEIPGASPTMSRGFTEGDAAQYLWLVPHDLRGLFDALGGNAAAVAKLDAHFAALNAGPRSEQAFLGNEPEAAVPYAYAFAGAPARTQEVVRRALATLYRDAPGGLPGNDDGGAMGSWATWATLGFFPAIPGVGGFVVSSPRFPKTTVHLANGATLSIDAPRADDLHPYVSGMELDGAPWTSPWIPWWRLENGAQLGFDLGDLPTAWGSDPADAPPSFE